MSSNYSYIYDELLKLDVNITYEDIPNPRYLQEKIIECNRCIAKTERFSIEISRALTTAERAYKIEKLDLEMLRRNTLTNDVVIHKIPTGKEREAAVDEKLEDNYRELIKLENTVNDLKAIQSSIKLKITTLRLANTDIKQLMKLMDQQINRLNIGHPDDPDIKELTKTYKEIEELEKEIENSNKKEKSNLIDEQLNVVESSLNISRSDSESSTESVKPTGPIEPDYDHLQVALDEKTQIGEPIVIDESDFDSNENAECQKSDSQSTEGIGETHSLKTDVSVANEVPELEPDSSSRESWQDTDDFDEGLASFLTDDVADERKTDDDVDREDTDEYFDEDAVNGENYVTGAKSEEIPDIDKGDSKSELNDEYINSEKEYDDDDHHTTKVIGLDIDITGIDLGETGISKDETDIPADTFDSDAFGETGLSEIPYDDNSEISVSNVDSRELELPKMDIDLDDMGIDLGISGMSKVIPEEKEDPTVTTNTNKIETQIQNEKSEEKSELDFDLEDILNSF